MLDRNFLRAMVEAMAIGSTKDGRTPDDWQNKEAHWIEDRFFAIKRHWKKYHETRKPHHLVKMGVNSMMVWYHVNGKK